MSDIERYLERESKNGKGSTWVNGRGSSAAVHINGYVQNIDKSFTSFFFTDFPEECYVSELYQVFMPFGKVGKIYVPLKRDRRGRRFGFVKFQKVADVEAWGGSCRMFGWEIPD